MAPESIEETQRRLGLAQGGASMPMPGQRPRRSPVVAAIVVFVVIGALVGVLVAANVFQRVSFSSAEDWSGYPATDIADADAVLAGESLEVAQVTARDMTRSVQMKIAGYGFRWEGEEASSITRADNGYGGESMLYDFDGDIYVGQVLYARGGSAGEAIIERFESEISTYPGWSTEVANYEQTGEESAELFGSSILDEQAFWRAEGSTGGEAGIHIVIEVFNSETPTVDEFTVPEWIPADANGTLFVRISASGFSYLAEGDRDAFIAALQPYEGRVKPD